MQLDNNRTEAYKETQSKSEVAMNVIHDSV
jgi:hypothetical protein